MKRFGYATGLLLLLTASCTKDGYLRYDTDVASLRFVYSPAGKDSTVYSFGLHPGVKEDIVEIPFKLIGISSSEPREVAVEAVKDKTTAIESNDFVIEPCRLPADAIAGSVKIKVRKNASSDAESKVVALRLCANNYFSEAPVNESMFRVVITNELAEPVGWIFNEYSRVKHEFVILHTGVATNYNQWSTSEQIYWKGVLIKALYEYNKAHPGEPLTDENGLVVTF
ncbi:DUF4843 domain-containing protein [Bacteroides pyogenes]|uniref:DUF4843 domain-containing protein n=1 Tax=Bacteroides pyogenes TaxID=310300 RepID=UPI0003DCB01B|nr:DUF4843 domain-containing protein [Bacteroides pyogenes]MBB3895057.1 hypothetical protein [Bacteroides pyogenes]MCE9107647.1 DUF4843 domain-containing protein [Bacteroides pyogenes]GAE23190.1 hypothetical protein JCM10003_2909 [Bacteroides pyogenes JCM 10003]SUV32178.1 Uncharacterised protein [Bacteroides pyogenes]